MSRWLGWLLGRLPIGWLQLTHKPTRFAASLAGVAFANILVFMQLGFLGALVGSIRYPYDQMNADLIISSSDMNTLADSSPLPRQRLFQALGVAGVASATPLYFARIDWKQADGTIRTLDTFGIDPAADAFLTAGIRAARMELTLADHALIDRKTRNVDPAIFAGIDAGRPATFETMDRTLTVTGTFEIGGGFSADGFLMVSDQTFLRLFPQRSAGAPNHVLLRLAPDADRAAVLDRLRAVLPAYDCVVRTLDEAVARDQRFQTTQRPVGLIFGFGIVIGVLVGVIIVYQVLSTDVADHLKEYATFKAIGYTDGFLLGIVFEEAIILALCGFGPGLAVSMLLYKLVAAKAALPLAMTAGRAAMVLAGTIVMSGLSGAIATRRLARANPADLF